jgi:hypothetical protein
MTAVLAAALVVATTLAAYAQEKEVPKDSVRLSIPGCVEGRRFIVMRREKPEPMEIEVPTGRRFRLNGDRKMLVAMQKEKASMIQITGIVRRSQVTQTGVTTGGGRVRITGGNPQAPVGGGVRPDIGYDEAVLDVESWQSLPDACPAR